MIGSLLQKIVVEGSAPSSATFVSSLSAMSWVKLCHCVGMELKAQLSEEMGGQRHGVVLVRDLGSGENWAWNLSL